MMKAAAMGDLNTLQNAVEWIAVSSEFIVGRALRVYRTTHHLKGIISYSGFKFEQLSIFHPETFGVSWSHLTVRTISRSQVMRPLLSSRQWHASTIAVCPMCITVGIWRRRQKLAAGNMDPFEWIQKMQLLFGWFQKILVGMKETVVVICLYMCGSLIDNASHIFIELCSSYQFAWSGVLRKLSMQWLGGSIKRQLDPRELIWMFAENLMGALVLHQHVFFSSEIQVG